jgi:hypothetical protein
MHKRVVASRGGLLGKRVSRVRLEKVRYVWRESKLDVVGRLAM